MTKQQKKTSGLSTKAKLDILLLAAQAVDTRRKLSKAEIEQVPSLGEAFMALDAVMAELGWGRDDATGESIHQRMSKATPRENRSPDT